MPHMMMLKMKKATANVIGRRSVAPPIRAMVSLVGIRVCGLKKSAMMTMSK